MQTEVRENQKEETRGRKAFLRVDDKKELKNPPRHHESADTYPLKTCVVSGEDLGSMGDPVVVWHKVDGQPDREVRFCCKRCVGRFEADPEQYLAKLDADSATTDGEACCSDGACAHCEKPE
jgi:hypothetical protein